MPVVAHGQGRGLSRRQQDLDFRGGQTARRVNRVAQQVDDHLLQPHPVGKHHHRAARQGAGDPDDPRLQLRLHHRQRRGDGLLHIDRLKRLATLAGIGFQLPRDRPHPVDQIIDPLERRQRLFAAPPLQQQPRAGKVGLHRGQRLVQFMAHSR